MNKDIIFYLGYKGFINTSKIKNNILIIFDEMPENIISIIKTNKICNKNTFLDDVEKIILSQTAKDLFYLLDLYSLYFEGISLDRDYIHKYLLPKSIELYGIKLSGFLSNYWLNLKKSKLKELEFGYMISINNIINVKRSLIFTLTNLTEEFISNFVFPYDLSIIKINEIPYNEKTFYINNINRKTKKFNLIRKYKNDKIIPYIDEDNLLNYSEFTIEYIINIYELNIEINVNYPWDEDFITQFNKLNNIII